MVQLPAGFVDVVEPVLGPYPNGDSHGLRQSRDQWTLTADSCGAAANRCVALGQTVSAQWAGATAGGLRQQLDDRAAEFTGQRNYCLSMAQQCDYMADSTDVGQLTWIGIGGVMVTQLAADAILIFAGGTGVAKAAVERAVWRAQWRAILRRIVEFIATNGISASAKRSTMLLISTGVGAGIGAAIPLGAQLVLMGRGELDRVDWNPVLVSAAAGAGGGLFGGYTATKVAAPVGRLVAKVGPHRPAIARFGAVAGGRVLLGTATGAMGGIGGVVASAFATVPLYGSLPTWDEFSTGVLTGIVGEIIGGAGQALHAATRGHAPLPSDGGAAVRPDTLPHNDRLLAIADNLTTELRSLGVEVVPAGALVANRYRDVPRLTADIDFLVLRGDLERARELPGFTLHEDMDTLELGGRLVSKDVAVDFLRFDDSPIWESVITRAAEHGAMTMEDLVVRKLDGLDEAGKAVHLGDIESILRNNPDVDLAYVGHWAEQLGLSRYWDEAQWFVGLPDGTPAPYRETTPLLVRAAEPAGVATVEQLVRSAMRDWPDQTRVETAVRLTTDMVRTAFGGENGAARFVVGAAAEPGSRTVRFKARNVVATDPVHQREILNFKKSSAALADAAGLELAGRYIWFEFATPGKPSAAPGVELKATPELSVGKGEQPAAQRNSDPQVWTNSLGMTRYENHYGTTGDHAGVSGFVRPDGSLICRITSTSETPSGRAMFNHMMDAVGDRVTAILGTWQPTTGTANLDIFNAEIRAGRTAAEAARRTFTGKMAAEHGFDDVVVLATEGEPGSYTKVELRFGKATHTDS